MKVWSKLNLNLSPVKNKNSMFHSQRYPLDPRYRSLSILNFVIYCRQNKSASQLRNQIENNKLEKYGYLIHPWSDEGLKKDQ